MCSLLHHKVHKWSRISSLYKNFTCLGMSLRPWIQKNFIEWHWICQLSKQKIIRSSEINIICQTQKKKRFSEYLFFVWERYKGIFVSLPYIDAPLNCIRIYLSFLCQVQCWKDIWSIFFLFFCFPLLELKILVYVQVAHRVKGCFFFFCLFNKKLKLCSNLTWI